MSSFNSINSINSSLSQQHSCSVCIALIISIMHSYCMPNSSLLQQHSCSVCIGLIISITHGYCMPNSSLLQQHSCSVCLALIISLAHSYCMPNSSLLHQHSYSVGIALIWHSIFFSKWLMQLGVLGRFGSCGMPYQSLLTVQRWACADLQYRLPVVRQTPAINLNACQPCFQIDWTQWPNWEKALASLSGWVKPITYQIYTRHDPAWHSVLIE